ncbi:MAG TPA: hypothetical protein VK717_01610 [Opitutaceae bacterium]|jgi:hypothetical protein|nr:hypothetical protein [Opitutaceae bacterium]
MNPRVANDESLFRRLAENNDESATVAMLTQLCRESPELRHWLWEDFARDAEVRTKFARIVDSAGSAPAGAFSELTNDAGSWRKERRKLREQTPAALYGGLTWKEIMKLIRQHQAGTIDIGVFVLAHDWRKAGKASPLLKWAGAEFLELVIPSGRRRLLQHLNKTLTFLKSYENKAKRRAALGHADRWKLHVLFYILQHPRESYRTRELRAHLATVGLQISAKETQRFCARHGIRRDMSAGRPRTAQNPRLGQ